MNVAMITNNLRFSADSIPINNPLEGKGVTTVWGLVMNVMNIVIPLAGIIFVGIFIYAGISYMMSTGDPNKVKAAQAMMTNAVIGFVIIAFSFVAFKLVQNGIIGTL